MTAFLQLDQVSKAFGAVTVADALSFEVQKGEALGVIGPNGAGKTSMFNLITGTLSPDAGQISFDGHEVTKDSAAKRCPGRHGPQLSSAAAIFGHDGL